MKTTTRLNCPGPQRREFLRVGSLSLLGISLSQYFEMKSLLAAAGVDADKKAKAQACILLLLQGGPSQVDTWDPKPNSGFQPISTNVAGIQVSETLSRTAKQMDKLALIRSMHTEEIDHPQATHEMITGHRPNAIMQFPSLGSIITRETSPRNQVPPYVIAPALIKLHRPYFRAHFAGAQYDPMMVPDPNQEGFEVADLSLPQSISVERIEDRYSFLRVWERLYRQKRELAEYGNLDTFREQALQMILSPQVKQAFDLSQESEKKKDAYGRHSFGQSVLLARRLVEAGSRFVTASGYGHGGWDTHSDNDKSLREDLMPPLDRALSTLLEDLEQRGLLESTIVVVMGEFGRTPHVNPKNGRDHWPHCWSLAIGGGGIRGGQVVGVSDERGAYVDEREVTMGDVFATIYKAFGIDWTKTYMHPIGRPIKIANSIGDKTGVPIQELL